MGAEGFEALEFLDGAAVKALGLGLIAEEEGEAVGVLVEAVEAFGEEVVAVLGLGDFVIVVDEGFADAHERAAFAIEGFIEAGGGDADVEAFDAEEVLLGEGDALNGEELLGVDGLVDGDEVFAEAGDLVEIFEADDGEGGGGEAVLAGVLGGAGFAFGRAGSGGAGGVGAVGGALLFGNGLFHGGPSAFSFSIEVGGSLKLGAGKWRAGKEIDF
jgi:hypothetical protein